MYKTKNIQTTAHQTVNTVEGTINLNVYRFAEGYSYFFYPSHVFFKRYLTLLIQSVFISTYTVMVNEDVILECPMRYQTYPNAILFTEHRCFTRHWEGEKSWQSASLDFVLIWLSRSQLASALFDRSKHSLSCKLCLFFDKQMDFVYWK